MQRGRPRGHRVSMAQDDVIVEVCGCGSVAADAEEAAGAAPVPSWQRRLASSDADRRAGGGGAHLRRRTGRSVGVLYLLLVLAASGCWPAGLAWPAAWPTVPSLSRLLAGNRLAPHGRAVHGHGHGHGHHPRGLLSGWGTSWGGLGNGAWNADAILEKIQRFGSGLLGGQAGTDGNAQVGKVLNFFPIPVSDECLSSDGRRTGICLNTYECRIQNGKSYGPCALGFGVCCVFTASCGDVIENNVTYFVSPNFPAITRESNSCELEVRKVSPDVSQLRLDFIHFSMGQPNRRTGVCESDTFVIAAGSSRQFSVCGQNSGQHIYFDVEDMTEPITIMMNMSREHTSRLWEIKVTQIEFHQRAPSGCLQYHREGNGVIQTMNFAENGRHLANQDYTICMRQAEGMCSIVYEPCDENSFKIGPAIQQLDDAGGSGDSAIGEAREQCNDKIVMPCDSEEFLAAEGFSPSGLCDLLHCGNSFCSPGETTCRIESSTTPFNIRVMFGPAVREESPEDNLGMCLKYEQQPCVS